MAEDTVTRCDLFVLYFKCIYLNHDFGILSIINVHLNILHNLTLDIFNEYIIHLFYQLLYITMSMYLFIWL